MNDNASPNGPMTPLPAAEALTSEQWRAFCASLLAEIERMRGYVAELQEQRRALNQLIPIPDDVKELAEKSFEELMAMCEGQPSIEEVIHQLEREHGN